MTENFQLALSEPPVDLIDEVTQISGAMFSPDEIHLIASALAALAKQEKHPSINLESFVSTTLPICHAHRKNLALALSIAQDRYINGINHA